MHVERRDRPRPDNTIRVMALFDDGRNRARDADAVATHHHGLARTAFVEIVAAHRRRVLRAQLEDLPDLDAAKTLVLSAPAARATVSFRGHPEIEETLELLEVTIRLEAEMVVALPVGTSGQIKRALQAAIDVDGYVEINGADEARRRARELFRLGNRRQLDEVRADEVLQLDEIRLVIASQDEAEFRGLRTFGQAEQ